jgi:hypothetical protein
MPEHYDAETLRISRDLYDRIRVWGLEHGGVTLIGGWAVYEHVQSLKAQQSRDVDLIIHNRETLMDFDQKLKSWGLQWRSIGRTRFNDCHLIGDAPMNIRVDIFKDSAFEENLLGGPKMRGDGFIKKSPTAAWLPTVEHLIRDKLETIPKRDRDREDKRLKDFIDIHNLAFFNKAGLSARDLAEALSPNRKKVLQFLESARQHDLNNRGRSYSNELATLEEWLHSS